MDMQASQRWLETLTKETKAKRLWESKYLTAEQQAKERAEEEKAFSELGISAAAKPQGRISERESMALRLAVFDNEEADPSYVPKKRVAPDYEVMRQRVAAEVKANRQRSHRFTGDLSIESMLKDIGPGLWVSINPAYAPIKQSSSSHRVHFFDKKKGWAEKVDKTHHLKMDDFMAHADKCLQLGEKPFTSGGMKLGK